MQTDRAPTRKPYLPPKNQRLDAQLYATAGSVGFFTVCAYARSSPFTAQVLNDAVITVLLEECQRMGMDLYVYCLMPDHLHILIAPREEGSSMLAFVDQFKGKSTRVSWSHGWQGKLWQRRSYDHLVRRTEDLQAIARYVLDNPVRRGLVDHQDDYPWAGLVDPLPW